MFFQNVTLKANGCATIHLHIYSCRRLPMPRTTYTTDQRMAALVELERCRGDILRASLNTGIPERTLYTWRRRFYAENKQQRSPVPPPLPKEIPTFENDAETLAYVRQQMMSQLVRLVSTFQEDNA